MSTLLARFASKTNVIRAAGFYTHSLALLADAFHYLNDLIGFIVALVAVIISENGHGHKDLSFGWQRAQLLGAFFNGVFLLALGVSIFLQSIERFINMQRIENPELILVVACIGFALNVVSAAFLHEHDHGPGEAPLEELEQAELQESGVELTEVTQLNRHHEHRHKITKLKPGHHHDLGMLSVLIHVAGDGLNNIGVAIAAAIIWKTHFAARYYADPAASMGIAFMILILAIPIGEKTISDTV
jgi:zinc transporter 1